MFCSPHNQNVTTEIYTSRGVDRHCEIDSQARVRLEKDSESMALGSFHDDDVAVMDVRLDVILMEVIFRYWMPVPAVVVCGKLDLTR